MFSGFDRRVLEKEMMREHCGVLIGLGAPGGLLPAARYRLPARATRLLNRQQAAATRPAASQFDTPSLVLTYPSTILRSRFDEREICLPRAHGFGILLGHHSDDLTDVGQVVNHPRRQQLTNCHAPKFGVRPRER